MQLAWLSDIHLNFVRDVESKKFDAEYFEFIDSVRAAKPDAVLISGDISEAPELCEYLELLQDAFGEVPVYFVLGNHDFYRGSIVGQRRLVADFCANREGLTYLSVQQAPISLTDGTSLIGHDSWADGRMGMYEWSDVTIADYEYIEELTGLSKLERGQKLNSLGDEAAAHVRRLLPQALELSDQVLFVTHVPPFLDACLYRGQRSSPEWAPHFGCKCVGETIVEIMRDRVRRQLTVLCGHTHEPAEIHPLPNVTVLAAQATYGQPTLQRILTVP
jgi:predicted MPP superfamily phosphohydrolase